MQEYFARLYKESKEAFLVKLKTKIEVDEKCFVVTANPEIFMIGKRNAYVNQLLLDADTEVVPDGIGLIVTGKRLGYDLQERIPGVELCESLLDYADMHGKSVYLFGGKPEVIRQMQHIMKEKYPNAKLLGCSDGYVKDKDMVFEDMKQKEPDIVFAALGMPQQEMLIYKHLKEFSKGIFIGVGGSFDVISGMKKRAPELCVKCNLEWLYRIVSEPKRWKRFWNNNIKFLFVVWREKRQLRKKK